ncbi:MAG TPA: hypothetical protein P5244_04910 [Syntrophales bacterium]|nr:hypothetical protein [Syntrophales bacterium]
MAILGKQGFTPVDALKEQIRDRDYLSCPNCKAFLADNKPIRPVRNFAWQFMDGREHITCPKCHTLLGRVYWEAPTWRDKANHVLAGDLGLMGRLGVGFAFGVFAVAMIICRIADERHKPLLDLVMSFGPGYWLYCFCVFVVPIMLIVAFFLTPNAPMVGWWWWWWMNKK